MKKIFKQKWLLQVTLASFITVFAVATIATAATTLGANISTTGTLTVNTTSTLLGAVTTGSTLAVTGDFNVNGKATTTAATGNIATGGTLTVTGLTTLGNASTTLLSVSGNSYLGTVSSGTWSGTAIGVTKGGTGLSDIASGVVLYTSAANTIATSSITAAGRAILDDTDAAAQLVTLGLTATAAELNYTAGVTSAIQGQLDVKQGTLTNSAGLLAALDDETGTGVAVFGTSPSFTTGITTPAITLGATLLTPTGVELNYVAGVTSAIQTQLNTKQGTLTNSAGLLAALDDETGTGVAVFGTSPSFTTGITTPAITLGATLLTPTGVELNYVAGVTSAIQTQLDAKLALAGGTMTGDLVVGGMATTTAATGNIATQGTITSAKAGGTLGWTFAAAANQVCTTTCTSSACVFGIDSEASATSTIIVACNSAAADNCLCAGN